MKRDPQGADSRNRAPRKWWRYALTAIFWLGLASCIWVLAENWQASADALHRIPGAFWLVLLVLLGCFWYSSIAVWRSAVQAHGIPRPGFADAASHLALLLLGKYLPGGVWGFLARHASLRAHGAQALVAGLFEQYLGVVTLFVLAAVLYVAVEVHAMAMLFVPVIPFVTGFGWRILIGAANAIHARLPAKLALLREAPVLTPSAAFHAGALSVVMQLAQLAFIAAFAHWGLQLPWLPSIAIAAVYGIAIVVGILSILVPGGIGVREATFLLLCGGQFKGADAIAFIAALRLVFTVFDGATGVVAYAARLRGTLTR